MADGERPDPDVILRRVKAEEQREQAAKLKIFFGFAPGVGKTFRMLQAARELSAQDSDVVVGIVETHGRKETTALVEGLEVLPRRPVSYRGRELAEFDLDAALARAPQLILVDELAHSNAEGSRHGKRWQDVLDLLDAGIDVFTTMNVQHVESLNDVVAHITQVQVRETVPDMLLERAEEIELIDISPEQLLTRLKEGRVYFADQAARAASHFFKRGNLLALRELALRQTAEHVESDVLEYREEHGVERTWAISERVLVSVGPSPASARLVRAARRMAAGLRAPWVAGYVETLGRPPLSARDSARLEANLRLAESLGATVVRLSGNDVAGPLLNYARRHNVTRLIIGKPTHARLRDRLRGSLLDDVVRASGDIDVHVISGDANAHPQTRASQPAEPPAVTKGSARSYFAAAALVGLSTALAALVRAIYPVPDLEMLYLLAVMVAAAFLGSGPSIFAATLSIAAYDFFFVPPFFTFSVSDGRYALSFAMMFIVSYSLSALTTRLRRQEQEAVAREERASALYSLSRSLGPLLEPNEAATAIARHAVDALEAAAAIVLLPDEEGMLQTAAAYPPNLELGLTERGVAKWVLEHRKLAGLGTDTLPGSSAVCSPLLAGVETLGVLALVPRDRTALNTEQRSFLEAFSRQAAFAFERARLSKQARTAALRAKTEELRNALLSAVSHDLRTPLAAITGSATSLRDDRGLSAHTRADLLESVCEEAERLERLVTNLLDMTRLEAGGVTPKREWVPLEEIVGAAVTRLEPKLKGRDVEATVREDVPLLSVDPILMQQLFLNLLENAAKYSPSGSPIGIDARVLGDDVMIEVRDRGPGLGSDIERVFEKFYRGQHAGVSGVGLGLAICRGIVEAHGGKLTAHNREHGGAVFCIRLPRALDAPSTDLESSS
jgi:two-component system, OmpR family, sensor histidine kinase KdpD